MIRIEFEGMNVDNVLRQIISVAERINLEEQKKGGSKNGPKKKTESETSG